MECAPVLGARVGASSPSRRDARRPFSRPFAFGLDMGEFLWPIDMGSQSRVGRGQFLNYQFRVGFIRGGSCSKVGRKDQNGCEAGVNNRSRPHMPDKILHHVPLGQRPGDFGGAAATIKTLIETRTFRKEKLEEETTRSAITLLAQDAENSDRPYNRLEAVAILGKAGEISKPIALYVRDLLRRALSDPLPPVNGWGNADDRYYLAKGISASHALWVRDYAAIELARADVTEKACD